MNDSNELQGATDDVGSPPARPIMGRPASNPRKVQRLEGWLWWGIQGACPRGHLSVITKDVKSGRWVACTECPDVEPTLYLSSGSLKVAG